ncbi:MAG: hypothetical protein C0625_15425 [Arcobacter sp.]|nr:MAG: hypothetical protein C0625_15425 [Arcobacter sp.]
MSRFRGKGVKKKKIAVRAEHIIPNFLIKNTINIIYAPPKQGKSMFLCGLVKWIYRNTKLYTEYYDNDNPLIALEDRGVDRLWEELSDRFDYIHPEELENVTRDESIVLIDAKDALDILVKDADTVSRNYDDTVFMFDSATDFCDESNDNSVKTFMSKMKCLRAAGATVIILHHTNKKDPNYKGSTVFKSATDTIYKLTLEYENGEGKVYKLEKDESRFRVENCGFRMKEGYDLEILDYEEICIPATEQLEIRKVVTILRQNQDPMKQGDLLHEALKTTSADKTATSFLKKYEGKYWTCDKGGRSHLYKVI